MPLRWRHMGRERLYNRYSADLPEGAMGTPRPSNPWHKEWAIVVGDRIRRLRTEKRMTLLDLSEVVTRPDGEHYSLGYLSRIERGWCNTSFYVYLAIADALEVSPARLLGPDEFQREVTEAEMTLLRVLRRTGTSPDEALARLSEAARSGE